MIYWVYLFFADAKVQTAGLSSSWLAIFKCRRGSAVTLLGISKCRRGSADRGWLFLSADAIVQTLALSLSSLDYAHISSSDTFRFWNWALASSKTQSDKPEVTLQSKNDEDKIVNVLIVTPQPNRINIFGKSKATNGLGTFMGPQVSKRRVEIERLLTTCYFPDEVLKLFVFWVLLKIKHDRYTTALGYLCNSM